MGGCQREDERQRSTNALFRVQQELRQLLVLQHLFQNRSRVRDGLLVLVTRERLEDGGVVRGQVLHGREACADLTPQEGEEDVLNAFLRGPLESMYAGEQPRE